MDFLEHEIEEILNIFREESEEQLQKLNSNLLKLESNPKDHTAISELFREAHSLKGAARMIGLDDIQSIAHKLEDVFGQAKEGYLKITPKTIDVMCRAVDCISSIVSESIRTRGKVEIPEIQEVLKALENVINAPPSPAETDEEKSVDSQNQLESMVEVKEEVTDVPQNASTAVTPQKANKQEGEIKNLLTQISVNIEKLKVFSTSTDALEEFLFFINKLRDILDPIDNNRLKGLIDDIKIKVEIALNGSGILVYDEVLEIEENFETFTQQYDRIFYTFKDSSDKTDIKENKETAPQEIPQKELPGEEPKKIPTEEALTEEPFSEEQEIESTKMIPADQTIQEVELVPDDYEDQDEINFIKNNIKVFSNHTEENALKFEEVISKLNGLTATINEDHIRQIIEKISDLLVFSKDKEAPINPDMVNVLEESFDAAIKMLDPSEEDKEDPSLILQRITVLYQLLKLAVSQEVSTPKQENESEKAGGKTVNYSPVKRNTDIYPKTQRTNEEKRGQADLRFGESNTIKTLRVDTQKLDHLVNQAGELIIAKIKTKEHLTDIEKMIRYVEEWHREWSKTKQYFRYANRHYKPTESGFAGFQYSPNKSINTFFEENSSKLMNLMNKMNSFYKVIQEDDAR